MRRSGAEGPQRGRYTCGTTDTNMARKEDLMKQVEELGGTVFPTASVGGTARAPASDDGTMALTAASVTGGTVPSAASVGGAPASSAVVAASVESAAEPAISGTVPSAASVRGEVGGRESPAGTASSDAVAETAPLTGDTVISDASVERVAGKLTLKAGSCCKICGERGASTHPFDPGIMFPLEVRYASSSSSSTSNSNRSSSSSSHKDVAYAGALLRLLIRGNDAIGVPG